jgi:hypothetical protein
MTGSDDVPLREHIEAMLANHQRAHNVQHAAQEEARKEAQADIQRRLEGLNELRGEVTKDRSQFMRLDVYEQRHQNLTDRVETLERGAIRDQELHASTVPAFRIVETTVDDLVQRIDQLERAAVRQEKNEEARQRQKKWLLGLTVTVILAVAAIAVNLIINVIQGTP